MKFFNYLCALLLISRSVLASPTDSRVSGGIAVIDLEGYKQAPSFMFNDQSVLVTRNIGTNDWQAWVGIALNQALGQASISVNGKPLTFTVNEFNYPEQRLTRSEEHTSELQSRPHLVCRLLLEKKKQIILKHLSYQS